MRAFLIVVCLIWLCIMFPPLALVLAVLFLIAAGGD